MEMKWEEGKVFPCMMYARKLVKTKRRSNKSYKMKATEGKSLNQ